MWSFCTSTLKPSVGDKWDYLNSSLACVKATPNSHWQKSEATTAPASCARMNAGAPAGSIPENESVSDLATVTAGLAKLVDAVNQ
jgi:hypothetical protein